MSEQLTIAELRDGMPRTSRRLWVFAAIGALALHLGAVAWGFATLKTDDSDDDFGAPGLEIGLELAAPDAPPTDLPPGPDTEASAASPAMVEQKAVEKQSELPKDTPQETDDPDRVVSPTATRKPVEDSPETPTAQATPSTESVASEATAMPTMEAAAPSTQSVTVAQGLADKMARVRGKWEKELVAYLDRHKRYPADRVQKTAEIVVGFDIDRMGHILASRIVTSSGDTAFDEAALAMLKRADPVPPPPPAVADESLSYTLPVFFRVKGHS